MAKAYRLQQKRDFRLIYQRGKSLGVPCFALHWRKNRKGGLRIGFSVSKKLGKAVARNKIKRRCREAARELLPSFPRGYDYIFVVRQAAREADYARLKAQMAKSLAQMQAKLPTPK